MPNKLRTITFLNNVERGKRFHYAFTEGVCEKGRKEKYPNESASCTLGIRKGISNSLASSPQLPQRRTGLMISEKNYLGPYIPVFTLTILYL